MDFSEYLNFLTIRRTNWNENPDLIRNLRVDNETLPALFVIEKIFNRIFYRKFDLNLGKKDPRETLNSLIKNYLLSSSFQNYISTTRTIDIRTTAKIEQENQVIGKLNMQDFETGLHLMLRNEIPNKKIINGEELNALKTWIYTLSLVSLFMFLIINLILQDMVKTYSYFRFNV